MEITLISVPYAQDEFNRSMGRAPDALKAAGLVERLHAAGIEVRAESAVSLPAGGGERLDRLGRLGSALAEQVVAAQARHTLPVILGGDCLNAIGASAGLRRALGEKDFGVAWFDAHGDFNTPDTTLSGYLPGMPLACACGRGLEGLRAAAGLDRPVNEEHVLMLGVRDLDAPEKALLDSTPVTYLSPAQVEAGLPGAAERHFRGVAGVYLHLDIDALDLEDAPGVNYPTPGGLSAEAASSAGRAIRRAAPLVALTLAAIDPEKDRDGKTVETGVRLLVEILRR
jgi:arginase